MVAIQFISVAQNNPKTSENIDFDNVEEISEQELSLLKSSCYDCHNNSTEYPWYFNVYPSPGGRRDM